MPALSPGEIRKLQKETIPEEVFEVFNELIAKDIGDRKRATVRQNDVINLIEERLGVDRSTIISENWLNVENAYRDAGWLVFYDCPHYTESYEPYFEFKVKE